MAYVFRRVYKLKDGKRRKARKWTMAFSDNGGREHRRVGFTNKTASFERACELEREAQAGHGIAEADRFRRMPLAEHVEAFKIHLESRGATKRYREAVTAELLRAFAEMGASLYGDLTTTRIERNLAAMVRPKAEGGRGLSHRTHNHRRAVLRQFCGWMVERQRAEASPMLTRGGGDATEPRRIGSEPGFKERQRRALTAGELRALLAAARTRPRAELLRDRPEATPEEITRAELKGQERATLWMTAALAGLRRSELAALSWANLSLDTTPPVLMLWAEQTKAKREDVLPLAPELAEALRDWKIGWAQLHWALPESRSRVFTVPTRIVRDLRADCEAADVAVRNPEGKIDLHALRHTFVSLMARAGTPLPVAQQLARHADSKTTARHYVHILGQDKLAAVAALPSVLTAAQASGEAADGTDGKR